MLDLSRHALSLSFPLFGLILSSSAALNLARKLEGNTDLPPLSAILACKWGVWLMFAFFQLGILRAGILVPVGVHSISRSDPSKVL